MIPDDGLALHDLYDATLPPVAADDFAWAHARICVNYGVAAIAIKDRFELVKELARDKGWSGHRFRAAVKNMLATKPYATWTAADILSFESKHKLKPYHNRNLPIGPAEIYRIGGKLFWREPDATELPFERVTPDAANIPKAPELGQGTPERANPERVKELIEQVAKSAKPRAAASPTQPTAKAEMTLSPEEIESLSQAQREASERLNQRRAAAVTPAQG